MRKVLLLSSLFISMVAAAQTDASPEFEWANLLVGMPGQDQATAVVTDGADNIYWMLTDGSSTDDRDVTYAGSVLYEGAEYQGTSSNKNLTILKTNAEGVKQWCVYSSMGDFAPSEGGLAVAPNGDLIFCGSVRHTDGQFDKPITIVDGNGDATIVDWSIDQHRYDRMIVGNISAAGILNWVRTYDIDSAPVPNATGTRAEFTADAITAGKIAVDADGNIYICGNYRTALTFPKADGQEIVLSPKNVAGWNGDSQATVGVLYLVKLDSNGYYLNHLPETGDDISASYVQDLEWADGKLYLYGYLKGNGTASVTVGEIAMTPTEYVSPIVGCLDADLKASWLKCLPGGAVGGKNAVQSVGITVADGNYWLCGQYNGRISDTSDAEKFVESTQGTLREGFVIKLDATTGQWLAASNSRAEFSQNYLTGYLKVIVPTKGSNIYVYGYAMSANAGVFLRGYDKAILVGDPDNSWNILTKGGVPTAITATYTPENGAVYALARGNQAFQPLGGELLENPGAYTNVLARFDLPLSDDQSAVEELIQQTAQVEITPVAGGMILANNTDDTKAITVIDLTGRVLVNAEVAAGNTLSVSLSPGIYVAAGKKVMIR